MPGKEHKDEEFPAHVGHNLTAQFIGESLVRLSLETKHVAEAVRDMADSIKERLDKHDDAINDERDGLAIRVRLLEEDKKHREGRNRVLIGAVITTIATNVGGWMFWLFQHNHK